MMKRWIVLTVGLAAVLSLAACGGRTNQQASASGTDKIKVSVTFDAMKEFAQAVGGDKVEISTIIPDGTEPHDFEPKARDLAGLSEARVFIYNGFGMERWVDQAVSAANSKNLITVEASKDAEPIQNTDASTIGEHGQYDPHLWISLKGAEIEARNIRDGLIKASPADEAYFNKNYDNFASQLESLFSDFNSKFQSAPRRDFVTGHAAFAYFCRDFGLKQNSVEDVFAQGEPTASKLGELVDYCKSNSVHTIFVEDMVSPAVSQTLADEVGAQVKTIYTIESSEDGETYLQRMQANLAEIYDSLQK